ncbi:MAG: carnitinyl-CoA dehydratase, partial [Rhodoferax sp.]|nr:carnitinyl-CoA dehydratase [Rhodoferax sp.]
TLAELGANPAVRAVVLRGDGDKAFVSGADISEFGEKRNDPAGVAAYDAAVANAQAALASLRCPVIAAVSGVCYGGGLGLILACDLRYAAPNARFRMPAARLGLGYAFKGIQRMAAVLGVARASELFYTARVYGAEEAARIGLVSGLHDDVFAWAAATAAEIAANAPLTVQAAKQAFNAVLKSADAQAASADIAADIAAVDVAVKACFKSDDYAEGRAAFAEKRTPDFKGR